MVYLQPMNEEQFAVFRKTTIQEYAKDKVAAGTWSEQEAPGLAEESVERHLPQGLATPDAYLYVIRLEEKESERPVVGHLWFNLSEKHHGKEAFLLDILIDDHYQNQGLGSRTMMALEEEVRKLGAVRIGLHVFGHNERAYHVYTKMGYIPTDITMSKEL
ncbi:GNAT family N-acetyltransferase [Paenibacillus sp. JX-17]|uniref:GNAT family N-acetyltransferase n=1 Tax=Paenibacillus lacisoli TaxID=3064525 RepID=A0ABT9CB86_9BACL|nr:GNAT family N-acetyltransferase [Paenibacillus sp. JX-17]MDO7906502.1 GNAT family N-acetyltransferase [Paenibacillus sp. JX-17]